MTTELTYFEDPSDSSSDEDEIIEPVRKRRRLARTWCIRKKYSSAAEAENAVQELKIWKKASSKTTPTGLRVDYRCVHGQYRVAECPAGLYLLYDSSSPCVSLYETENQHDNHTNNPSRGLSSEMKMFIEGKYKDGIRKPNALLNLFRQHGMVEPKKSKLVEYLKTLRVNSGTPSVSASEIRKWCSERSEIPCDEDEPYVIDFHIVAESYDADEQDLKIVITTRRLLSLAKQHMNFVQTDATCKLIWQGYPFLLVGTSDANYVFHPFAVAITKGETQDDFQFIFHAIKKAVPEWKPTVLLADGSEAITNAFTAVFGAADVRLMCFFHVIKNVDQRLRLIKNTSLRSQLKEDIYLVQTAQSQENFQIASALFIKNWEKNPDKQVLEFILYFEKEWLSTLPNWYEGAAVGIPSSNNGLEATNSVIKKEHTFGERYPVGQFLGVTSNMVQQWSERRNPKSVNCVFFYEIRSVSLELWTKAYQWVAQKPTVLHRNMNGFDQYFTSSSTFQTPITTKLLKDFEKKDGKWKKFEDYSDWRTKIWKIEVYPDHVTCTCPYFVKKNQCKHAIGMQIKRKEVQVPEEAKNIPLGQKRKRGRPSKAKQALLVQ